MKRVALAAVYLVMLNGCAIIPTLFGSQTRLREENPGVQEEASQAFEVPGLSMREEDLERMPHFTAMLFPLKVFGEMLVKRVEHNTEPRLLQPRTWTSVLMDRNAEIIGYYPIIRIGCRYGVALFYHWRANDLTGLPWWGLSHDRKHIFGPDGNVFPPRQLGNRAVLNLARLFNDGDARRNLAGMLPAIAPADEIRIKEFHTGNARARIERLNIIRDLDQLFPGDFMHENGERSSIAEDFHAASQITNNSTAGKRIIAEAGLSVSSNVLITAGSVAAGGGPPGAAIGLGLFGAHTGARIVGAIRSNLRYGFCASCTYTGDEAHAALELCTDELEAYGGYERIKRNFEQQGRILPCTECS